MKNISIRLYLFLITLILAFSCDTPDDLVLQEKVNENHNSTLSAEALNLVPEEAILRSFWMREDHEPWHRGKAEIYAFVIGLDQDKDPIVKNVPLPFADHDKTVYYRNLSLINWSNFYYNTVAIIFIEADDPHFTEHDPNWEFPLENGGLIDFPIEIALRFLIENFRLLGEIDSSDDIIDVFENINRFEDYDVVGGRDNNVFITLEGEE